jgi:hypothetical protein
MKRFKSRRQLYLLSTIAVLLLLTGCSSPWLPSDETAVQLVNDYYLFYHSGEKVKSSVIERGEYIKECECYPIKFKIISLTGETIIRHSIFIRKSREKQL